MESWSLASRGKAGENSGANTLQVALRLQGSPILSLLGDAGSAGLEFIAWCRMSKELESCSSLQHGRESLLSPVVCPRKHPQHNT